MKPNKPRRTEAAFTDNKEIKRLSGYTDQKRDSKVKDINIALYDVDYAIKWQLENVIQPTVTEENAVITVPVLFSNGEKWAAIQRHGYLRDNQGKLLTPLIMIKRNGVTKREDIQDLKVLETPDARITFEKKYSKRNRYDRFSLNTGVPEKEFYSVDVPKFVQLEYDLLIWTNNTTQLNEVVEQLIWFDGKAFGDSHKFITHIDPPTFESVNSTGEDRIVRASMPMRTKAYILNTHGPNAPAMYKINPVTRLVVGQEIVQSISGISAAPTGTPTSFIESGTQGGTSITSYMAVLTYVNNNNQLTGTVVSSTTVTFASGWTQAPSGLPATSVNNFIFFANGILIERSAIISFTQSGGSSTLVVDVTKLGYSLIPGDEVVGIGKFINQDNLA